MNQINHFNNKQLNNHSYDKANLKTIWCDVRSIENSVELSQQYMDICHKYDTDNKWILMINPADETLQLLSDQGIIDPRKILKVNIHQRNITLKTIEHALEKGHCSAVILCNATLEKSQVSQLTHYAEKGQTKCIILKKQTLKKKIVEQQTQNVFKQPSLKNVLTTALLSAQLH